MRVRGSALKWAGLGIAAAAVVFAVVLASRFGTDPGLVESPLLGEPAPTLELPLLGDSTTFDTSDLTGSITVVNFFASWCPECREEHSDLVATAEAFKDRGVRFVQISYQESPEASIAYLDEAGRSESTLYLADPGSRAAIAYGVFGIPETFFIDAAGTVVGKIIGEADAFILGATLDTILAGNVPGQKITGDTQQQPDE
jgi:cytochrome c biogenesis protein CcmG/thiol:disulfide interchange protein DsbE